MNGDHESNSWEALLLEALAEHSNDSVPTLSDEPATKLPITGSPLTPREGTRPLTADDPSHSSSADSPLGVTNPHKKKRTYVRFLMGILGLLVLVPLVAVAYSVAAAQSEASRGVDELGWAKNDLTAESIQRSPNTAIVQARRHVTAAHHAFSETIVHLDDVSSLLSHLGWMPFIGHRLTSAPAEAHLAEQAASGILLLLAGLEPTIRVIGRGSNNRSSPSISQVAALLASSHQRLMKACAVLDRTAANRSQLSHHGDASLTTELGNFDRQLTTLVVTCRAFTELPALLGYPSPRHYLIAFQDPLELRATGGFIGSIGLLTMNHGRFQLTFSGTDWLGTPNQILNARDNTHIPPPEPVLHYNTELYWLFRDSNWSPDFPTSAQLEMYFLHLDTRRQVQGVFNVTPAATAEILRATGPIYLRGYRVSVSSGNVATLTDHYTHASQLAQHLGGDAIYGPTVIKDRDTRRKQFINAVAQQILTRLRHPTLSLLFRLGRSLNTGVEQKDILAYFGSPAEESLLRSLGASGQISSSSADYIYLVDTNIGYTKNNAYVHFAVGYDVRIRPDRWLDARLTVRVTNLPAPLYLRDYGWYGPCGGRCGGWDDYATYMRVYVPLGSELIDQAGWTEPWSPGPAYGKTEFPGFLVVPRGQTRTVVLHYVVPPNVFSWSAGHRYKLLVVHQPGSIPRHIVVKVHWDGGSYNTVFSSARWDRTLSLPIPYQPLHAIPLPLATSIVAPGHVIEPHAFLAAPSTSG